MMSGTVVRADKPLPETDSTGEIWRGVRRAQWPWKSHLYPKNSQVITPHILSCSNHTEHCDSDPPLEHRALKAARGRGSGSSGFHGESCLSSPRQKPDNLVLHHMSLPPFQLLPQCWSSERVIPLVELASQLHNRTTCDTSLQMRIIISSLS
ncbi:uncharacterized protein RBU33_014313 isoform 3-T3 [Hipposideros larvatus]